MFLMSLCDTQSEIQSVNLVAQNWNTEYRRCHLQNVVWHMWKKYFPLINPSDFNLGNAGANTGLILNPWHAFQKEADS